MRYEGVKFKTKREWPRLAQSIFSDPNFYKFRNWCLLFAINGFAPKHKKGSYGNVSYRLIENEFLITCSNTDLIKAPNSYEFAHVEWGDFDKQIVHYNGKKKPSSESMLHYAIYKARHDVQAIFHGHNQDIIDWAENAGIVVTENERPYGTKELADEVLDVLGSEKFIVMKNHGFLSLGSTLDDAGNLAIEKYEECVYHQARLTDIIGTFGFSGAQTLASYLRSA